MMTRQDLLDFLVESMALSSNLLPLCEIFLTMPEPPDEPVSSKMAFVIAKHRFSLKFI